MTNENETTENTFYWFVLMVKPGSEFKTKERIHAAIKRHKLENDITEVFLPLASVYVIKKGARELVQKAFTPGYMYLKTSHNPDAHQIVSNLVNVVGFVGRPKPTPISDAEVKQMKESISETNDVAYDATLFKVGDKLKVLQGPFADYPAVVHHVDNAKGVVHVSVNIFGRETPVEMSMTSVEKITEEN